MGRFEPRKGQGLREAFRKGKCQSACQPSVVVLRHPNPPIHTPKACLPACLLHCPLRGPPPTCRRDALADVINRAERSGEFGGGEQLLPLAGEALRAARAAACSIRLLPAAVQREQLHKDFLKVGLAVEVAGRWLAAHRLRNATNTCALQIFPAAPLAAAWQVTQLRACLLIPG